MSNDRYKVLKAYEHAIEVSGYGGFVNYEGIACERACFAAMELGLDALPFIDRAIDCYSEWGADRKTESMQLLQDRLSHPPAFSPIGKSPFQQ